MPTRTCQWCRSKHGGQFFELVPGEWYCVECAAERLFKAGQLPKTILTKTHDAKLAAIEDAIFGDEVDDIEVKSAVEELQQWIEDSEV